MRHTESESNLANSHAKSGNYEHFTDEFRHRAGSDWRLTEQGVRQSITVGKWISRFILNEFEGLKLGFDLCYTSPYARAGETGAYALPEAVWHEDRRIRERDWGDIASISDKEFKEKYPENARKKEVDPLYWRPPGGESIAQMIDTRIHSVHQTLHWQHDNAEVNSVCLSTHGEYIWGEHIVLEALGYAEWMTALKDPSRKIKNGQVVHFSRISPDGQEKSPEYSWVRSVCPWETPNDEGVWRPIERKTLSSADLLARAAMIPPLNIPRLQDH